MNGEAAGLLSLRQVTKRFGGLTAVDDVSLDVRAGSIHGFIGPNGAGKSTLVNVIAGALRPTQGEVLFADRNLSRGSAHRAVGLGIARTFQEVKLFGEFSVLENVACGCYGWTKAGLFDAMLGLPRGARERRESIRYAQQMLDFVGIRELENEMAVSLPYGHRRMVEIARALAAKPRLVLLDEPAAGMNANERQNLVRLIERIREAGHTVIVIEHHMDVIMGVCETITVLSQGKLLSEGTPEYVQNDPAVIAAYLGGGTEN